LLLMGSNSFRSWVVRTEHRQALLCGADRLDATTRRALRGH
jgi:hypothetical protein